MQKPAHTIAIIGAKGGVGTSTLAANLSLSLARETKARVLLLDLDPHSLADQCLLTGAKPAKNLHSTLSQPLNSQTLNTLSGKVRECPAWHLLSLKTLAEAHAPSTPPSTAELKRGLTQFARLYQYIVLDLGHGLDTLQCTALESSQLLLCVSTPSALNMARAQSLLKNLDQAMWPRQMSHLVLNQCSTATDTMPAQTITQALRLPLLAQMPRDDASVTRALKHNSSCVLVAPSSPMGMACKKLTHKLTSGVLQRAAQAPKLTLRAQASDSSAGSDNADAPDAASLLKMQIHKELIGEMDLKKDLTKVKDNPQKAQELKMKTQAVIARLYDKHSHGANYDRKSIVSQVLDEALGLGPLEELLRDPQVTEIMVNGAKQIFVERSGKLTLSSTVFTSNLQLRNVIERIMSPLGRRIDEKTPYQDARLADGSRVNAVIEPLALDGPSLTIRKFPSTRITMGNLVKDFQTATEAMAHFLKICVEQGLNIIISGGTGSGKTTLLNCMSGFIPASERIVTVEDAAELQLKQSHVVRLETRPPNVEGQGAVSIRDLVRNSLRMRPDRIVVGECRDGAALDMLSAMNTGHDGSMTTVHANNPKEAISRLETLCLMAGMELPINAIRDQIAGAVNLIVQISRLSDGSRKITSITEIVGMQSDVITLQEIFRFKKEGFDKNRKIQGQFQAMGLIPTFIEEFEARGIKVPRNIFTSSTSTQDMLTHAKATPAPSGMRLVKPSGTNIPKAAPTPVTKSTPKPTPAPLAKPKLTGLKRPKLHRPSILKNTKKG